MPILLSAVLLVAGCSGKTPSGPQRVDTGDEGMIVEGLSDSLWTYISLREACVKGVSKLGSAAEDALWADREDWDIAICGDLLRTNGGASGIGVGGIQRNVLTNFYNLTEAPADGYIEDVAGVVYE